MRIARFVSPWAFSGLLFLSACSSDPNPTDQKPVTAPPAAALQTAPPPSANTPAPADDKVNYAGHYTVLDSAACPISVTITRVSDGYTFTSADARGRLRIEPADGHTYFTFEGWQMAEPSGRAGANGVSLATGDYQDGQILLQNYGNAMNEYTMFSNCESKFVTLEKVR